MVVLDTDVLSILQRQKGDLFARLGTRLAACNDEVYVTIVSFEEQMRGWLAWIARARTLEQQQQGYARLRALLEDFQTRPVLDFDERAAEEFRRLARGRIRIGTMDRRIAAITLAHNRPPVPRLTGSAPPLPQ